VSRANNRIAFRLFAASAVCAGVFLCGLATARAQFEEAPTTGGPKLDKTVVQRIKIGVTVTAVGGPCKSIVASAVVPMDWPEQKVRIDKEDVSSGVNKIEYRNIGGGARQMIITIPNLANGQKATAFVTFEVTRRALLPPDDPTKYKIPTGDQTKLLGNYLAPSPFIESRNSKIIKLAKEVTEGKEDWAKIEAIYKVVHEKLTYKEGLQQKGAVKALADGDGHCEEFSDLFIALCRAVAIPARTVWVPGHCYSEFYMVDDAGKGYWFPCQSAGDASATAGDKIGGIPDTRPILQKGDNFKDPDRPKDRLHYLSDFLKGAFGAKGSGKPTVQWCRETLKD